jgi:hypothetical protein
VLNEPTLEKLKTLHLDGILAAWNEQQKNPEVGSLAFDERLGMLIDAEWIHRENKRIKRLLTEVSAVACERRNLSVAPTGGAILAMT